MSGGRIQVHGVLDTGAHPSACLRATVLVSGSSIASTPPGSLTWKEASVQFLMTVDITGCFMVMEVVKQFEICIFHIQGLGFPCIFSACVQIHIYVQVTPCIGEMKIGRNAMEIHISTLCFLQSYNIPLCYSLRYFACVCKLLASVFLGTVWHILLNFLFSTTKL